MHTSLLDFHLSDHSWLDFFMHPFPSTEALNVSISLNKLIYSHFYIISSQFCTSVDISLQNSRPTHATANHTSSSNSTIRKFNSLSSLCSTSSHPFLFLFFVLLMAPPFVVSLPKAETWVSSFCLCSSLSRFPHTRTISRTVKLFSWIPLFFSTLTAISLVQVKFIISQLWGVSHLVLLSLYLSSSIHSLCCTQWSS